MPEATRKEPHHTFCEEVPSPPGTLGEDGKKRWDEICGYLLENGNLARLYLITIERACVVYDKIAYFQKRFKELQDKNLLTKMTPKGVAAHPITTMLRAHETQFSWYLEQLGMTPKTRKNGNLPIAPGTSSNPKAKNKTKGRPENIDKDLNFAIPMSKTG